MDAGIYVRRIEGPALTAQRFAAALALPAEDPTAGWQRTTGPDGSEFAVKLSTDRESVSGPDVGAAEPGLAERAYDCYLHVTIVETADDGDSLAALRSYCRAALARLHGAEEHLESAYALDSDGHYGYRADLPALPERSELELWLAAPAEPTEAGFSLAAVATRAAGAGPLPAFVPERPGRLLVPEDDTGDAVTYTLALRAEELPFAAGARADAAPLDSGQLAGFTDRLLAELAGPAAGADLACWVNGRLHRYEVELPPRT